MTGNIITGYPTHIEDVFPTLIGIRRIALCLGRIRTYDANIIEEPSSFG